MENRHSICLVGHSSTGKSTLAAMMLAKSGITTPISFDPSKEEKDNGYSIDLGIGSFQWKNALFTILDAPGGAEFIEEVYKGITVADLNLLVIHAEKGIEVVTERAWEIISESSLPAIVFVNQLDRENADFEKILSSLKEESTRKFVALQLPIFEEGRFVGLIDLLTNKALYLDDRSKKDVPKFLQEKASKWREVMLDEICSLDDELMRKFLEEEEISPQELYTILKQGIATGAVTAVLCGSVAVDHGIDLLMDTLLMLTPAVTASAEDDFAGLIFNITADPYLGQLRYLKLLSGSISPGTSCFDLHTGGKKTLQDIYSFNGTKEVKVTSAGPGEIVALGKLESLDIFTTIAAKSDYTPVATLSFPKPGYARAVIPKSQSDVEKMSTAIKELVNTKKTLKFERNPVTHENILWGMGDIHLAVFIARLKNRYNVFLDMARPRIPYKETIQKEATAQYRHKKQSGGRGQFGEVFLSIKPLARDTGFQFIDAIKGASIPGQYIPGVEKGVIEAMEQGVLAQFPVVDVAVTVFDGKFHPVDSSELAFKLAASRAFKLAMEQAQPVILEPTVNLTVRTPELYTGDIISDLNSRRGKILGMEPMGKITTINAKVPLAELQTYSPDLKSLTQGRATFWIEPDTYQPVPANLQQEIINKSKKEE
ncbi:elongation factor G [Candidatus Acetothermia bacterium]|nr:elongation factor G [Candidatus Acetothermia bacterium]